MADPTLTIVTDATLAPLAGDTGERDITTLAATLASGAVYVSRNGPWVTLDLEGVVPTADGNWTILTLPNGFRAKRSHLELASTLGQPTIQANIYVDGRVLLWAAKAAHAYRTTFRFRTIDAWPAVLPGTA